MSKEECRRFEKKLAFHTAPSLLGIKCASLFTLSRSEFGKLIPKENANEYYGFFDIFGKYATIMGTLLVSVILVYSPKLLAARLSAPENRELLREYGYTDDLPLDECLERLSERTKCDDFPHEIGIFLGYPAEDVRGFVENGACNYKLCGCWKVYGSVESARRKFAAYDRCREYLCGRLEQGEDLYQALKIS